MPDINETVRAFLTEAEALPQPVIDFMRRQHLKLVHYDIAHPNQDEMIAFIDVKQTDGSQVGYQITLTHPRVNKTGQWVIKHKIWHVLGLRATELSPTTASCST